MTTAFTWLSPTKRAGQLDPVGQLPQQRRAGMADHAGAVGGGFVTERRLGSLHPQGALHDLGYDRETAVSSLVRGLLAQLEASPPTRPHEKRLFSPIRGCLEKAYVTARRSLSTVPAA